MSVDLVSILVPRDVRSWSTSGDAQKSYLVTQNVLKIEMRSEDNFCTLKSNRIIASPICIKLLFYTNVHLRVGYCSTDHSQGPCTFP